MKHADGQSDGYTQSHITPCYKGKVVPILLLTQYRAMTAYREMEV